MTSLPPYTVLVVAAGRGIRLGGDMPKQYLPLGGKPVLRRTLDTIMTWPGHKEIQCVIAEEAADLYQKTVHDLHLRPFVPGGNTRKESVCKGLESLSDLSGEDIILIHDAARLFTPPHCIKALLERLKTARAASLALPVADTLKYAEGTYVRREGLWALQTPQAFRYADILNAHKAGKDLDVTDDTSLVAGLDIEVCPVPSSPRNFKITTMDDFHMAEALIQKSYRSGTGFDVHAFEDHKSSRPLILCGVKTDHPKALAGHSDADVGLHAITDALLGAMGEGDIGEHFPPSNPDYKNADSAEFLAKACALARDKGADIINIDVTLICEAPRLSEYKPQMRKRIAEICAINEGAVNVKATTTEKLGFTGRGEGIAAQAIVTVSVPDD